MEGMGWSFFLGRNIVPRLHRDKSGIDWSDWSSEWIIGSDSGFTCTDGGLGVGEGDGGGGAEERGTWICRAVGRGAIVRVWRVGGGEDGRDDELLACRSREERGFVHKRGFAEEGGEGAGGVEFFDVHDKGFADGARGERAWVWGRGDV